MTRTGCEACGRNLYFSERVAWPSTFCFPCACTRGIVRLADRTRYRNLASDASKLEPWWRWTVYVRHALQWTVMDARHRSTQEVLADRPP